jgi:AcrR family transcriptional regulator
MSSPGLRERKKQKTRWAIQEHALRLFAEQGYEATTVDQIAAAAEISPSTFFRYFKTKEDLVIEDEYDALMETELRGLPPEMSPLEAIRAIVRTAAAGMAEGEEAKLLERSKLVISVPALRARSLENFVTTTELIRVGVASRLGRSPDDVDIRAFAGAVVGVMVAAAAVWVESDGAEDFGSVVDRSLSVLDTGLSR